MSQRSTTIYGITAGIHRGGHVPQHFSPCLQSPSDSHWGRHGNKMSGSSETLSTGIGGQHPSCSFGQQYGRSYHECTLHKPPTDKHLFSLLPHDTSARGWPYTHGLHSHVGQPFRMMYRLHFIRQKLVDKQMMGPLTSLLLTASECVVSMCTTTMNARERRKQINDNCMLTVLICMMETSNMRGVFICYYRAQMWKTRPYLWVNVCGWHCMK